MPAWEIFNQGSQRKGTLQKHAAPSCDRNFRFKFGKKRMLISISTNIDEKRFVFFEHTIGHLSFVCVHLDYFSFFSFFFISFFFVISFLHLAFKMETLRGQTSINNGIDITKNWRLPEIGSEMPEDSSQTSVQKFWTFEPFKLQMAEILKIGRNWKGKNWGCRHRGFLSRGSSKIQKF